MTFPRSQYLHHYTSPAIFLFTFFESISHRSAWFKSQCSVILPFRLSFMQPTSFPSLPHSQSSSPSTSRLRGSCPKSKNKNTAALYCAVSDPQGHPVKLSNVQTANWAHQHLIWNTRLFLVLKALKISIKNVLTEVHYNSCKTCIFLTTVSTLVQVYYRPLTPPLSCPLSDRDVSSLIRTAQCGTLSSRSSAPSVSPYGTSTTMASSSQLERDGTPSSWRRRDPWETTHSPSRKGCRTWR